MKTMQDIGIAIRMARVAAGENQTEFGAKFGVGHGVVGVWEGEGRVPKNRWATLNSLYGVDIAAMIEESKNGTIIKQKHSGHASAGRMEVTHHHGNIDLSVEEQMLLNLIREKDRDKKILRRVIAELLTQELPEK